ncbi:CREB-H transcription factor homolog let-607-like [Macrosteles quadrilineatus]|uniref:CREB-H transcription factor homolog let-607-like n=1 Tax=Macrosteles quadrilineatus TaxID=74068 RepID=UPI0023E2A9D6|nr:CREB-H transcription factor homolog let-607-like [Macrosteles quadrilineatus]
MTLPTDMSFMDLLLDKEDNLLNFEKDLIDDGMKFSLDHKNINNDDWSNDVDFLDSLLEMEDVSQSFDHVQDKSSSESDSLVTPAGSVVESSSCSDSGVSCDQQMSPRVQDMDDVEEVEEVVIEEEVYTDPVIKEEVVEIDDDSNLEMPMETVDDVKQEEDQHVITLNVPKMQSVVNPPPMVRVKPVAAPAPRRVIRVTPLQSNNPRSILIPVNGVAGVRTIKIINAGSKTQASLNARAKQLLNNSAVITSISDEKETVSEAGDDERETVYPRLQLSAEEKRLMVKEGITLPTHYPLTKHEERELKRIRRKIRNKISAQDSRKRKKEYVDGLEERVKQCTEENLSLLRRLKVLQTQNQSLCTQLRRLQAAVVRGSAQTTQPATCLMVLVLSLALVMAPNLRNSQSRPATDNDLDLPSNTHTPLAGRSRTLLFSKPADQTPVDQGPSGGEEVDNKKLLADLEELLQFNKPQQDDHDYSQAYTVGRKRTKSYIVPDIDDTWPPPKIPRQEAATQPIIASHNKTRNPPEERKFIVELPE